MATYYWVGGSGTWDNSSTANWAASSGGAGGVGPPTITDFVIFDANSGTAATVTVSSTAVAARTTINKSDINITLNGDATLSTGVNGFILTTGTLTLNSYTLTCAYVDTTNSNTRAIDFGTGNITVTGNAVACWSSQNSANLTISGTPVVNATYAGGTGIRYFYTAVTTEATAISFNIKAGTDTIGTIGSYAKNVDFTGFSGTWNAAGNLTIVGNLIVSSGMTVGAATFSISFSATSAKTIATNGKTIDRPVTFNGVGGSWALQDNLTVGATRTTTLINGTIDLTGNSGNWTLSTGLFASSYSNIRSIVFGTGSITVTGTGTVWNTGTVTNFSYTGTPTVNVSNNSATAATVTTGALSEAQALNFNYTVGTYTLTDTNAVYRSLSFSGFAGTVPNSTRTIYGDLTIASAATNSSGSNTTTFAATSGTRQITTNGVTLDYPLTFNGVGGTFAFLDSLTQGSTRAFTLTNGTIQLKDAATSTVGVFATSGTNQKFLQSTAAGSQATLSQASGTVNANNLTIQDINATGGATWNAFYANGNIDSGNNTGWDFGATPSVVTELMYRLRSFTTPRRF